MTDLPPFMSADTATEVPPAQPDTETPKRTRFGATRTPKQPAAPKVARPPKSGPVLKRGLMDMYASVGMVMMPFDPQCGAVVVNSSEACADSLVALAEENPAVRRALESLLKTSAWGGVFAAHLPLIMAVTAHHIVKPAPPVEPPPEAAPQDELQPRRATNGNTQGGKFCAQCHAAVVPGIKHVCP